jgi:hypothetical protein
MTTRSLLLAGLAAAVAVPAVADNEAVNPGFVTDLGGWTVLTNPAYDVTHDTSQSFNSPGSLRVSTPGPTATNFFVIRQCRPVTPGQILDYGGKYRFESGHAANLKGSGGVTFFTDAACSMGAQGGPLTNSVADVPDTWLPIHANNVPVQPGFNSALFLLGVAVTAGEGVGWFDDVYFGPDPLTPVELQRFTVE